MNRPWGHVSLHVDVHAVEEALDGVRWGQEEVGHVVADGADKDQLPERLPNAARPGRQPSRGARHGFLGTGSSCTIVNGRSTWLPVCVFFASTVA